MTSTILRHNFTNTLTRSILVLMVLLGSSMMNTISGQTDLQNPDANSHKTSKSPTYQLRIYDVPKENSKAFHDRFQDHAFRIMKHYDFKITNMWISESDDKHEFVYLLEWEDESNMKHAWEGFMADQEWADIKVRTSRIHGTFVNGIEDRTLFPTDYSNTGKVEISFDASKTAALFAQGVISTRHNQRDFILSPSNDELFYVVSHPRGFSVIMHSKKIKSHWTRPEVAIFSGRYNDFEPTFSPDGSRVYFSSSRPGENNPDGGITQIWVVNREGDSWGAPEKINLPVENNKHIFSPTIARNGNLYFNATMPGGIGREDIWMSRYIDGQYSEPMALDSAVNSPMAEFNAFVCPNEEYLIFTSWGRKDDHGRGDLYISFKNEAGEWSPAVNMGNKINSTGIDYNPYVSADKKYFFFTSDRFDPSIFGNKKKDRSEFEHLLDGVLNGSTNIYIIDFDEVMKLRDND